MKGDRIEREGRLFIVFDKLGVRRLGNFHSEM